MRIVQKRVQNVDGYIPKALEQSRVRLITAVEHVTAKRLAQVGAEEPVEGLRFLPAAVGPVSRFNVEGRWIVRRDRPKERRFIRNIYWRWKQWRGKDDYEEKEDVKSIFRDCFPRDFVEPPAEEITIIGVEGVLQFATDDVELPQSKDRLKHQINLMLELFGEGGIVDASTLRAPPKVTRRSWRFLPPGNHPWDRVRTALGPLLRRLPEGQAKILEIRQKIVTELGPDEVAVGQGGFNDYLAYLFKDKGLVVLESIRRDNAIYVFDQGWEQFSQLSKAEILRANVHRARIVHATGWERRLREVISAA